MNQKATDFLKSKFYAGQITGDELMRRVEAEVRREIASEIEQLQGERDETAKELSEAKALVSERESRLANIKFLLEPIYGSTNYAPIGSVLDRVLNICDRNEGKPDPDRIGDPAFIKDMRPTVAEATGLRAGPCLEVAKELYRDGQTNLPDGLKS